MQIVPIENFGVAIEVPFLRPMGFTQARLEDFGSKICDAVEGLSLRPDQIRLRRTDELYNYELSAQFFGENGWLVRTSDRVKLGIRNARTAADWKVIQQTFQRFYELMRFDPKTVSVLSAHAHAKFPNREERDDYLQRFAYNSLVSKPAALGYVQIADWEKEIRLLIEHSNLVTDSVFVCWDSQFTNTQDWSSFLESIPVAMENSANLFDLGFEPLRQTV